MHAHSTAVKAHFGAMEAHSGVVEAHSGDTESHPGVMGLILSHESSHSRVTRIHSSALEVLIHSGAVEDCMKIILNVKNQNCYICLFLKLT
jgi:hypothetical protein